MKGFATVLLSFCGVSDTYAQTPASRPGAHIISGVTPAAHPCAASTQQPSGTIAIDWPGFANTGDAPAACWKLNNPAPIFVRPDKVDHAGHAVGWGTTRGLPGETPGQNCVTEQPVAFAAGSRRD